MYMAVDLPMQLRISFNTVAMALASIVLLEGLAIMTNSNPISIGGTFGLKASTVMLAGLQLAIIGAVILLTLVLTERLPKAGVVGKLISFLPLLGGIVILMEGAIAAYLAGPMVIHGVGNVQGLYVSAFAVQLYMLGAGLVALRLFRSRSIHLLVNVGALTIISAAGVMMASMAGPLTWTGVGGFKASTISTAGILLAILGLVGIALYYTEGWKFLGREIFGIEMWLWGVFSLGILIAFAGAAVISLSAPVILIDQTSFKGSTVALAGLMMFILGLLTFMPILFSQEALSPVRKATKNVAVFVVLLLPFALLV